MTGLHFVLLGFLAAATITDVHRQTIPNTITYTGIVTALVLRGSLGGWDGLEDGLKGFAGCGAIMLVCFIMLGVGGGDLKLVAMMGAFLGLYPGFEALLWTLVLGGVLGLVVLIWQVGSLTLMRGFAKHLKLMWQARGWVPVSMPDRQTLKQPLFLAPAALAAALIVGLGQG